MVVAGSASFTRFWTPETSGNGWFIYGTIPVLANLPSAARLTRALDGFLEDVSDNRQVAFDEDGVELDFASDGGRPAGLWRDGVQHRSPDTPLPATRFLLPPLTARIGTVTECCNVIRCRRSACSVWWVRAQGGPCGPGHGPRRLMSGMTRGLATTVRRPQSFTGSSPPGGKRQTRCRCGARASKPRKTSQTFFATRGQGPFSAAGNVLQYGGERISCRRTNDRAWPRLAGR